MEGERKMPPYKIPVDGLEFWVVYFNDTTLYMPSKVDF